MAEMGKADSRAMMERDRQVVGLLVSRFERYWQNIRPRVNAWKELYKTVQFFRGAGPRIYKYNFAMPISFTFVENFVASIMNPLFEAPQTVEVLPTEGFSYMYGVGFDDFKLSRQLERCLIHFMDGPDSPFYESFESVVRMLGYYGTAVGQVIPEFSDEFGETAYSGPTMDVIELWDFVMPPGIRNLKKGSECFIREIVTQAELERREQAYGYRNVKRVFDSVQRGDDDTHSQILAEMGVELLGDLENRDRRNDRNARVLLLHHYAVDGHVTIVAGGTTVVYSSRNPKNVTLSDGNVIPIVRTPFEYYPFESERIGQGPKDFYGVGIAQLTKQAQDSINIRKSQVTQMLEMVLFKPLLWNVNRRLDTKHLFTGPGNVIPVSDLENTIKALEMGALPPAAFQQDQQDWMLAEEASGSMKVARGQSPGNRVTATGSTQLLQSSQQRFSMAGTKLARMIARIAMKTLVQVRQHLNQQEYERIIGEPDAGFYRIPLNDVLRGMDFKAKILSLNGSQRIQRYQSLIQMMQVAAQVPVFNMPSLIYEMVREMFPERDPLTFLMPEVVEQVNTLGMLRQNAGLPDPAAGGAGAPANPGGAAPAPGSGQSGAGTQGEGGQLYRNPMEIVERAAEGRPQ